MVGQQQEHLRYSSPFRMQGNLEEEGFIPSCFRKHQYQFDTGMNKGIGEKWMLLGKCSPDIFFGIASFLLCKCQLPFSDCQGRLHDHFKCNCLYSEYQDLVTSPTAGQKNLINKVASCFVHVLGKWINWLKKTVWKVSSRWSCLHFCHCWTASWSRFASASHSSTFTAFFSTNAIWFWGRTLKNRNTYILSVCICISSFPTTPRFCPILFNGPKLQEFHHFHRKAILAFITLKVHSIVTLGLAYILFLWELKMCQKPTVK